MSSFEDLRKALGAMVGSLTASGDGLRSAMDALTASAQSLDRVIALAETAQGDHEDMVETVHRLEGIVMGQQQQIAEQRQQIADLQKRLG